ncbi:unnamed protein product [Rangifer tarandus platyrhynchus]|uniref:Uncharacterized protein n=1 Tax=Rangifer tarandus platyrhynchus TaxID=3082113 RepID=A0ABN8YTS6_RANTA|nr:unnamed protein product [Rangifer tarandus platyrhynchus]
MPTMRSRWDRAMNERKGIVGPPRPLPERRGAEARIALLIGPDRAGPRTSRPGTADWGRGGPGIRGGCRRSHFHEALFARSRNLAGEAEEC